MYNILGVLEINLRKIKNENLYFFYYHIVKDFSEYFDAKNRNSNE